MRLVSVDRLERLMKQRDVSGNELALLARVGPATVSALRRGTRQYVTDRVAASIERVLRDTVFEPIATGKRSA